MALILRRAWMEMVNVLVGGVSTPLSVDTRFDDRIISQRNAYSSRVRRYSLVVSNYD
jgi:hypothetical protein